MKQLFDNGDKVQFRIFDKNGKEKWYNGVIHGVRSYETPEGIITGLTYLVDTGRSERTEEVVVNPRDEELSRRVNKLVDKDPEHDLLKATIAVSKHTDLPADNPQVKQIRQPEQIELTQDHIRKI